MGKEKTFVLVLHSVIDEGYLGMFLKELEKRNLTIIGLKYMNVNHKFAETHLSRPGRTPYKFGCDNEDRAFWVDYLTTGAVVALLLEGENAIKEANECSKTGVEVTDPLGVYTIRGGYYASASAKHAKEDMEFWFNELYDKFSDKFSEDCLKDMILVYQSELRGDVKKAKDRYLFHNHDSLQEFYYTKDQTVVLIRPVAVRERLVGEIINGFMYNCTSVIGLKLVNENDLPASIERSPADSSSSGTAKDIPFCVAMVLEGVNHKDIILTTKGGNRCSFNPGNRCSFNPETTVFYVDDDLVYISESGASSWELMDHCFQFGFVQRRNHGRIGMLEASLGGICY